MVFLFLLAPAALLERMIERVPGFPQAAVVSPAGVLRTEHLGFNAQQSYEE